MVGQDEVGPKPDPRRPERKQRDVTPYVLEPDFWTIIEKVDSPTRRPTVAQDYYYMGRFRTS